MNCNILSVIPVVIPIVEPGSGRWLIDAIGSAFDEISSFVGFDVRIPIKVLLVLMLFYIIYRAIVIFVGGARDES